MANFYLDNSDLKHHLNHPLMKKLVALRETELLRCRKIRLCALQFQKMPWIVMKKCSK